MTATAGRRGDRPLAAIGAVTAGILMLAIGDVVTKDLLALYSPLELILLRSPFVLIPPAIALCIAGSWHRLATRRPAAQLGRGAAMAGAYGLYLMSLRSMPMADATALMFSAPFVTAGLSRLVLGEAVPWHRWVAIALGFAGAMAIVQPGGESFRPEGLWALAGAVSLAVAALLARSLGETEPAPVTAFYTALAMLVLGAAGLVIDPGQWLAPAPRHLALMALVGLVAGTAHFLIVYGYGKGEVSLVAPFEYVALPAAALLGFVAFGDVPSVSVWVGMAVIACAGYLLTRRR